MSIDVIVCFEPWAHPRYRLLVESRTNQIADWSPRALDNLPADSQLRSVYLPLILFLPDSKRLKENGVLPVYRVPCFRQRLVKEKRKLTIEYPSP